MGWKALVMSTPGWFYTGCSAVALAQRKARLSAAQVACSASPDEGITPLATCSAQINVFQPPSNVNCCQLCIRVVY
jgi:hypothetical protein